MWRPEEWDGSVDELVLSGQQRGKEREGGTEDGEGGAEGRKEFSRILSSAAAFDLHEIYMHSIFPTTRICT